jgi:hypothetical protein
MPVRDDIVRWAEYWSYPDYWKPYPEEIVQMFHDAGCRSVPTLAEAKWSLTNRMCGIKVGPNVLHWCGIFATMVLTWAGVDAKWNIDGGKLHGKGVSYRPGAGGMRPGDVAVIPSYSHHFIVIEADYTNNKVWTVEGNTPGQQIITSSRRKVWYAKGDPRAAAQTIHGYYQIVA